MASPLSFMSSPFAKTLAGGVACLGLTVAILLAGAGAIRERESGSDAGFTLDVPELDEIGPDEIGPAGSEEDFPIDLPPFDGGTDDATVEREPVSEIGTTAPAPEPVTLQRPIVLAAGRLGFSGRVLELEGILPVAMDRQCDAPSGPWPCGRMARTALANYVRGRSLDCTVPAAEWSGAITARCTLSGKDLSLWLVENGWAEAVTGSELETVADRARTQELGLFGPDLRRRLPGRPSEAPVENEPGASEQESLPF